MTLSDNISRKLDQAAKIVDLDLDWELIRQYEKEKWVDFPDLSSFISLQKLSICGHQLSFLPKKLQSPELRSLDLSYNFLTNTQGISSWPQLTSLDLSFNELQQLDELAELAQLSSLYLSHNYLNNIQAIAHLTQLKQLSISGNRWIKNLEPLTPLQGLEVLFAKQLFIGDWAALKALSSLREIYLSPVNASGIDVFTQLPQLEKIHISAGKMGEEIRIPEMGTLRELTIQKGKSLSRIKGLEKCPNLEVLDLSKNHLSELPSLSLLKKLREITLKQNPLTQVEALFSLENLEKIDLRDTGLKIEVYNKLSQQFPSADILY